MRNMILTVCVLSTGLAAPVLAANATHPYQNCDRRIDNCGPTGDDKTDQLNAQQLGGPVQTAPMPANPAGGQPLDQGQSQ